MSERCYQGGSIGYGCGVLALLGLAICLPVHAGEKLDESYLQLLAANCRICHVDGVTQVETPSLENLTVEDIKELLTAFRSGRKSATIMNRISRALSDEEIDQLSAMIGR